MSSSSARTFGHFPHVAELDRWNGRAVTSDVCNIVIPGHALHVNIGGVFLDLPNTTAYEDWRINVADVGMLCLETLYYEEILSLCHSGGICSFHKNSGFRLRQLLKFLVELSPFFNSVKVSGKF